MTVEGAAAPEPDVEAGQLAERARRFYRVGDWDEALRLTEASLLLKSDQPTLREAVVAHGALASRIIQYGGDKQSREQLRRGVEIYLRGWEHFEEYLRVTGALTARKSGPSVAPNHALFPHSPPG